MDSYSVNDVAKILSTSPETVRRWIRAGKLEAIQYSKKEGNIITKEMLEDFLKRTPKYAGITLGLAMSPLGALPIAALFGSAMLQQSCKTNDHISMSQEELKSIIRIALQASKETIENKQQAIEKLHSEIDEEMRQVEKLEKMIHALEE